MTKKILYILIAAPVLLFTACKKDYLDTAPTDAYPADDVFTTVTNGWAAINGIHRSLYMQYDYQDQGGQGSMMIINDMMGDDLVMTSNGNTWFFTSYQWTMHRNSSATLLKFTYLFYYKIIANANAIINNIDYAVGSEVERKAIKGQARAYRAWAYFALVQMYGKRYDATSDNSSLGVPLVLTNTVEGLPRASVAEVYKQINFDIDSAIINLNGFVNSRGKSHISANTAKGIKARIALAMQDWTAANQYAAEAKSGFTLMTNEAYVTGFNDLTNVEWMWGSRQIAEQTTYFYSFFAFMSANYGSSNIRVNPKAINSALYNKITATDVRKTLWSPTGAGIPVNEGARYPYINKKFLVASTSTSIGDVPLMRAAEMYLTEAEAKSRLGQDGAAADVLYTLAVNRDPAYVKSTATGDALLQEILTQRRVELWGEGFRFFDLKRMHVPLDRTGANHVAALTTAAAMTIPADDIIWEFLIPQDEVNANKAIEQNPI
jgi:hypothetical protein